MPQLLCRGIELERLRACADALVAELAVICSCGTDNFSVSVLSTECIYGPVPFIEVGWFNRGAAVRDALAACITRHLAVPELEVVFVTYDPAAYYIEGAACAPAGLSLQEENERLKRALQAQARGDMSTKLKNALYE